MLGFLKKLQWKFKRGRRAPWTSFYTVCVTHTTPRNSAGWENHDFWTPGAAKRFALAQVAMDKNSHASIYLRLWYNGKVRLICRVTKTGIIKEFPPV